MEFIYDSKCARCGKSIPYYVPSACTTAPEVVCQSCFDILLYRAKFKSGMGKLPSQVDG
jgi:DNA-directed RNA polymerase subunit RPC12/RpoP